MGGLADVFKSDIWKFTLANNTWEFMGNLSGPKSEITGFSVSGLSC